MQEPQGRRELAASQVSLILCLAPRPALLLGSPHTVDTLMDTAYTLTLLALSSYPSSHPPHAPRSPHRGQPDERHNV